MNLQLLNRQNLQLKEYSNKSFFASDSLVTEALGTKSENFVNLAYTDYGGSTFDLAVIDYFKINYPDAIVYEITSYSGYNAFIFDTDNFSVKEFLEITENYPLGFENLESLYYDLEFRARKEAVIDFLQTCVRYNNLKPIKGCFNAIEEIFCAYGSWITSGFDYSESDMIEKCLEAGLLTKKL